eukprot:5676626-Amphidinium_carterae.1
MSFGDFEGGKLMLHNPSKHSEGQYDEVSTFQRWVEVRPGQIHGVTKVTTESPVEIVTALCYSHQRI